jgi:hypothetical protein
MRVIIYSPDGRIIGDNGNSEVPAPEPMLAYEVCAVLNVVLGIWSLEDAANAIRRLPEDLVAEAQAWAVASGQS